MATSVNWNNTAYSIPASGETNWSNLSNFLIALANNAQTTNKFIHGVRADSASSITVNATTDFAILCQPSTATTVTLPAGVNGQTFIVADANGTAGSNTITVQGTGGQTINGSASYAINQPRGSATFQFSTSVGGWAVVSGAGSGGGSGTNFPVRTATSSPVTLAASDFCVMTNLSVAGAVTVNLPAGIDGVMYAIVDAKGDATTNNITITPASGQINGASTYVINRNKGGVLFQYNATETQWKLIAEFGNNILISPSITTATIDNTSSGTIDVREINFKIHNDADLTKIASIHVNNSQATGTTQTFHLPAVGQNLVGVSAQQTLTNKDIDGGTASDNRRITVPQAGTATLAGLTRKEGTIAYDTDLDLLVIDNGSAFLPLSSGSGSGEINAILNPSAATSTSGWTAATNYTLARDTSNSVLAPVTSTTFSLLTSTASSESSTSGAYYPFTLPTGLENTKLKIDLYVNVPASSAGVWRVSIYDGTTRLVLSTDSSGATTLPGGFIGKFTTYFDSTANNNYTLSITQTTRSSANTLYFTGVVVGPGIQPRGSAVGETQSITLTESAGFGTATNKQFFYERIGNVMHLRGSMQAGTVAASVASLDLPAGFTIDTARIPTNDQVYQLGYYAATTSASTSVSSDNNHGQIIFDSGDTNSIYFAQGTATSVFSRSNGNSVLGNSQWLTIDCWIPIAEWAGSGTVNLAQNDVEYVFNTSITDANDTTSFGYGPQGGLFPSLVATSREKRVRFLTPVQASDQIVIEWSRDSGATWTSQNFSLIQSLATQNTLNYGIGLNSVAGSATDYDVVFGAYRVSTGGTFGSAGALWGDIDNDTQFRYRVKKVKSGTAVGFGLADTAGNAGLVNPYSSSGAGVVYSGTYTPTLTNGTNVTGMSLSSARYTRVGSIVTVTIHGTATLTAANTGSTFTATLPVSSTIGASGASGTIGLRVGTGFGSGFVAGGTNNLQATFVSNGSGSNEFGLTAQYIIA